jgi:lipid-binding SYLF domain-containing protein
MQDRFKVGAEAGITVATLGSNAQAATSSEVNADIFVWASSSGAYIGLTLEGSVIEPRPSYNQSYYGRPVTTADIVLHHRVSSPQAARLVSAVRALG